MKSRYYEWSGGIGDALNDIYGHSDYAQMQSMQPEDVAVVSCISHNPHIVELFQHWPSGPQIKLRYFGYPDNWQAFRLKNRLPQQPFKGNRRKSPITFHNHPSDGELVDDLPEEYLVFSVSAGQIERNLPDEIVWEVMHASEIPVVFVGRDYDRNGWGNHERLEVLWGGENAITLIDRLSLPATVNVIRDPRCKGVVCCHSAMYLVAGWEKKPMLLLYPESERKKHFQKPDQYSQHAMLQDNAFHGTFDQWKPLADQFFKHITQ